MKGGATMSEYSKQVLEEAFDRFTNFDRLGKGGEGAVYAVYDLWKRQDFALKVMQDMGDPKLRERFYFEYGILAVSGSKRLVKVFDRGEAAIRMQDGQTKNHFWYTMERCSSSLRREYKSFSLEERIEAGLQLLDALAFLHAKGVAHRDIKPENIFLVGRVEIKLGDFGLAMPSGQELVDEARDGLVLGSPPYLAPERWTGEVGQDFRPSDQYAAAVVFFELLSRGHAPLPFAGRDLRSYYEGHMKGQVLSLSVPELGTRRLSVVDRVIQKMLAKRPGERYPDIASCKRELSVAMAMDGVR
jgi:eukaryotic-like serine/threonine-protein kinase